MTQDVSLPDPAAHAILDPRHHTLARSAGTTAPSSQRDDNVLAEAGVRACCVALACGQPPPSGEKMMWLTRAPRSGRRGASPGRRLGTDIRFGKRGRHER